MLVDIVTTKSSLTAEMQQDVCIKHAILLQEAFAMKNYTRLFKLYEKAPKMSGYLIDWFVERVRKDGLKLMVKSYVSLSSSHKLGGGFNNIETYNVIMYKALINFIGFIYCIMVSNVKIAYCNQGLL